LAVGAGGISNASTSAQTISNNLSLSASAAITAGAGNVTLAGNLTNGGNAVAVGGAANTTINGVISGSGSLTKSGAGSLNLTAANTYTGATTISAGTVVASSDAALGATNGSTTVADGAALSLSGGITSAENITITGSGVGGAGAIRSLGDGENTLGGTITLGGNARINADSPIGGLVSLLNWGSGSMLVDDGFTDANYTQLATTLVLSNAASGQTLYGTFASDDWSAYSNFGLQMAVTGTNPNIFYALDFYGSGFEVLANYRGSTDGITSSGGISLLELDSGGFDLSAVEAIYFTWADTANGFSATISNMVSVPSSGLAIQGNIQGGSNVLFLGAGGPTSEGVGGNVTVSGIVSGAGNSYSNTTTSVVKDGAGILTFSGANTYTGDTRVEAGTLTVAAGGTLGNGSDVFVSSGAFLRLLTNSVVSSIQGADTNAAIVFGSPISRLTMNGANKGTVVQNGRMTGEGGLTLAASGNTVLRLTADNDFIGSTVVSGGTLELATTGENQGALRLTTSVSIASGATLLISDSDQIRDTASITLSGGTIQRGSGVNEIFGNLNISGGSTLDFGSGAIGTLQFQTYSYTGSSLVEVQNFLAGNRLQFLSSSFNSGSLTQFDFNGIGYSTSLESGYFTITAIPEPSTYLAVAGLIAVMLWPSRRRIIGEARKMLGMPIPS
jgi:autotransporter-associated beta strand protein